MRISMESIKWHDPNKVLLTCIIKFKNEEMKKKHDDLPTVWSNVKTQRIEMTTTTTFEAEAFEWCFGLLSSFLPSSSTLRFDICKWVSFWDCWPCYWSSVKKTKTVGERIRQVTIMAGGNKCRLEQLQLLDELHNLI